MATPIYVNIGSCNGLLPDVTKPLLEPRLTSHQWSLVKFTREQFQLNIRDQWVDDFDDDLHTSHQNSYGRYGLWPQKGARVPGHPLWCSPGPCINTATWRCRKNFSQWECSFHWKLRCHWLEFLRQLQIAAVVFAQFIEAIWWVENEDVVGAAPIGDAPTTSEWWTILLPTDVRIIIRGLPEFSPN